MYYQYQSSSLSLNITIQVHLSTTMYINKSCDSKFNEFEEVTEDDVLEAVRSASITS